MKSRIPAKIYYFKVCIIPLLSKLSHGPSGGCVKILRLYVKKTWEKIDFP